MVGILLTGSCLGHGHTLEERAKAGGLGRKLAGPTLVGVGVIVTLLRSRFPCISFMEIYWPKVSSFVTYATTSVAGICGYRFQLAGCCALQAGLPNATLLVQSRRSWRRLTGRS